jgi:dihydroorotate dehydrogenase
MASTLASMRQPVQASSRPSARDNGPILAKLTPNVTRIADIALAAASRRGRHQSD